MVWMLSQFVTCPTWSTPHPVCAAYSNGHLYPEPPVTSDGWAFVACNSGSHQIEAAAQDPRVNIYRTLWDPITPQTVISYAAQGAKAGMMLGQLIQLLAQTNHSFITDMKQ